MATANSYAFAVAVLALGSLVAGMDVASSSSLKFDEAAAKKWPVSKVTTLLKDMLKQMEKEAEEDEEIYDKVACWCETNDKEMTQAIKDDKDRIAYLTVKIPELGALVGQLTAELAFIDKKTITVTASYDQNNAIRSKALAEFNQEEKDMLQAIESLKAALVVLGKHHTKAGSNDPNALLQVGAVLKADVDAHHQLGDSMSSHLARAAGMLKHQLRKHTDLLQGVLDPKQKRTLAAFLDAPADYFDAEPTFEEQSYQPKSGVIYGILLQMLETFKKNLNSAQDGEAAAVKSYEANKISLKMTITDNTALYQKKELQLAAASEKLAHFKIDLLNTKALLESHEKYLEDLKMRCQMTDQDWELRQKMRAEEIEAISKVLAMLNSDEAHALFGRTFNPEFLQVEAGNRELQARAAAVLKAASPRLATLAMHVRLDAFTKVKKAINDMIAQLLKEKKDDITKRDFCIAEFNKNELATEKKESEKADLIAKIEDLEMTIEKLAADIKALKMEIEEMKLQLEKAGKNRDDENTDFQQTMADQQATQKLLAAALKVLAGFYGKKGAKLNKSAARDLSLLQVAEHYYESESTSVAQEPASAGPTAASGSSLTIIHEINVVPAGGDQGPAGPPAPPGFKPMNKNEKSGGVMGLLEGLIGEAKAMEEEAMRDEKEAQQAYEDFVLETTASIEEAQRAIVEKTEEKAKMEADLAETHEALESTELELDTLHNLNLELHRDCDFLIKNFDASQSARDGEIEALKTALSILSGAKFVQYLETGH